MRELLPQAVGELWRRCGLLSSPSSPSACGSVRLIVSPSSRSAEAKFDAPEAAATGHASCGGGCTCMTPSWGRQKTPRRWSIRQSLPPDGAGESSRSGGHGDEEPAEASNGKGQAEVDGLAGSADGSREPGGASSREADAEELRRAAAAAGLSVEAFVARERRRRERISAANKGKTPWNKGIHHSEGQTNALSLNTEAQLFALSSMRCQAHGSQETKAKIRERTKLAMSNPEETRDKIKQTMRRVWELKKQAIADKNALLAEWKEHLALAAKIGGAGDEELEWPVSRSSLRGARKAQEEVEQLPEKETPTKALSGRAAKRGPRTLEHRLRISEAIKAKWANADYRDKVQGRMRNSSPRLRPVTSSTPIPVKLSGNAATDRFVSAVMAGENIQTVKEAKAQSQRAGTTLKTSRLADPDSVTAPSCQPADTLEVDDIDRHKRRPSAVDWVPESTLRAAESPQCSAESSIERAASFIDPFFNEKLTRIKTMQEERASASQQRWQMAETARMLMAEAERAASALESSASMDEATRASLLETRRLLAEAASAVEQAEATPPDHSVRSDQPEGKRGEDTTSDRSDVDGGNTLGDSRPTPDVLVASVPPHINADQERGSSSFNNPTTPSWSFPPLHDLCEGALQLPNGNGHAIGFSVGSWPELDEEQSRGWASFDLGELQHQWSIKEATPSTMRTGCKPCPAAEGAGQPHIDTLVNPDGSDEQVSMAAQRHWHKGRLVLNAEPLDAT
eukprot:SM000034S12714  [mRNA]  locus=s34:369024:372384:- [translate_table: standard]